ncbi:MFS transporter [Microscilla marina]|uniref:MFS permease (Drug), putative n=1 Tax=Microscilla marina ATCC 23134 TaxID=313606 RepID=A1ZDT2_MICM2|nr:MFS transporter [Microscilla marina]EAY31240.1 MFS permease (drug), putative [Microscilla marina ATCC 23134]
MTQPKVNPLIKITLLIGGTLVSMGDAVVMPLQPAIAKSFAQVPNIKLLVNYVLVFNALFIAIGATIVGLLIERFSKKKLLIAAFALYGLAGTSGLYLNNIYLLIVSRALIGLSIAGIMTILFTFVADYFEGEARSRFMGFINGFSLWASVAFLYVVAPLAAKSWHHPFAMYGVAFLLIPLAIISLHDKKPVGSPPPSDPTATTTVASDNLSTTSYPKALVILVYTISFVAVTLVSLTFIKLPDIIVARFSTDIYYIVTGFAVFLASGAASSMFLYTPIKQRLHYQLIYALVFIVIGIGFITINQANTYPVFLIGVGLAGLGYGLNGTNTSLWIMSLVPLALVGRFMGIFTSLLFFAIFVSPNITSVALKFMDVSSAFLTYGIIMLVLAIGLLLHGIVLSKKAEA